MRTLTSLVLLLALVNPFTLGWLAGLYVVDDGLEPADAVVALRGSPEEQQIRTEEAAKLVRRRYAPILLLSVNAIPYFGHPERQFIEEYLNQQGFPAQQLRFCENTGNSTAEEALAVRDCLERMGAKEIILVTSEYHTRRSRFIYQRVLSGSGIVFRVHPAYSNQFWDKHWWRKRIWAKTFFEETVRMIWAVIEQGSWSEPQPQSRKAAISEIH